MRMRLAMAAVGAPVIAASPAHAVWVASWSAPPHAPLAVTGPFAAGAWDNVTLRQTLRLSQGGRRVRVRFTNRYGARPLMLGGARIVRLDAAGNEVAGSARPLRFGGAGQAVVPRGADYLSDPVALDLSDLARVRIDLFLPQATGPCGCHAVGMDTLQVSPPGDFVGKPFAPVATAQARAFVSGVEVDDPGALGTIVAFGDSITDGVGSTAGADRRWPDVLAERLHAAGRRWGVANAGISGNRLLSPGMGDAALARFPDDVLTLPNVRYLILFEGVNDLGMRFGPQTASAGPPLPGLDRPAIDVAQMIAGYRQFIARAHDHGIKVIGSPIGPYKGASYWSAAGEAARQKINDWILHGGAFDGIVRFDTAFADPADPAQMRAGYHMGDHLHGTDVGLKAAGESIPLALFGQ